MKFQKFVKALGSDGIVYNRKNGEQWLASERVFMKIPEDICSVTCADIADMPDFVENIINYDSFTNPCDLTELSCRMPMGSLRTASAFTRPRTD